ncbi:hypothetical protein H920_13894 [Fukomys damarensis]|uniref:Uncharacterized protein n=1 Tax=Fukomys damarensis TaxID=885580 RepID=A0A091D2L4_FUKDA|nr:hypothetical protein H920_13894 [Fukomys damarensis]
MKAQWRGRQMGTERSEDIASRTEGSVKENLQRKNNGAKQAPKLILRMLTQKSCRMVGRVARVRPRSVRARTERNRNTGVGERAPCARQRGCCYLRGDDVEAAEWAGNPDVLVLKSWDALEDEVEWVLRDVGGHPR